MSKFNIRKATKSQARLRLALIGPAGAGKTFSALSIATGLGQKIAVIDTERGSSELYADKFQFDVIQLESFDPRLFVEAIHELENAGYDIIIIDSLSHAWMGKDGALEMKDNAARRQKTENGYTAWRDVTPHHNALVDAMLQSKAHIIATIRAKTEYVQEKDDRGKTVIRKVGLQPVQRDGLDFEFTIVGDIDTENTLSVSKTRWDAISGKVFNRPGKDFGQKIAAWLSDGAPAPLPAPRPAAPVAPSSDALNVDEEALLAEQLQSAKSTKELADIGANIKIAEPRMEARRPGARARLLDIYAKQKVALAPPVVTPPAPAAPAAEVH